LCAVLTASIGLCGCQREKRDLGPSPPVTPPISAQDPRSDQYQKNLWQISQGGRLFAWYGCQSCHSAEAQGALDLKDGSWRNGGDLAQVWASIAEGRPDGMPAYRDRIPVEQIWQIAAYVRDLHNHAPPMLRRQDADQGGEPRNATARGSGS